MRSRSGRCGRHRGGLSSASINVLRLAHDQHALVDAGGAARVILRSFDHDRAGQAHQHLRLHFAMYVGVIPVEAFGHVGGHVEVIGKSVLATALRSNGGVSAVS